jgi:hypothetical protein
MIHASGGPLGVLNVLGSGRIGFIGDTPVRLARLGEEPGLDEGYRLTITKSCAYFWNEHREMTDEEVADLRRRWLEHVSRQ